MGFEASDLPFVLAEGRRVAFAGTAFAVGGTNLPLGGDDLAAAFADFGRTAPASSKTADVLHSIGFAQVEIAPDIEAGTRTAVPARAFDAVFDFGATMRVFHVRRALAALGERVAVGGRIVHAVPSANHIDQDFYMASPRLFHDYYRANGWRIDTIFLTRLARNSQTVEGISYTPGSLSAVAHGGLDDGIYRVFCAATRLTTSTTGSIPQHGLYTEAWAQGMIPGSRSNPPPNSAATWLRDTRWVYRIAHALTAPGKKRRIRQACLVPAVRYAVHGTRG